MVSNSQKWSIMVKKIKKWSKIVKKSENFLIRIFCIGRDPPPFWPKVKKIVFWLGLELGCFVSGGVLTQGTALCHQIWSWTQLSDIRDQGSHVFTLFFHICTSIYISLLIICYKCNLWTYLLVFAKLIRVSSIYTFNYCVDLFWGV